MKKLKIYYAHCITLYGTKQEERDVDTLESLGFDVLNPNASEYQKAYKNIGMKFFEDLVLRCDGVAFRGLPDGSIPAGVAKEIETNGERLLIELPNAVKRRSLSVNLTREYICDTGVR